MLENMRAALERVEEIKARLLNAGVFGSAKGETVRLASKAQSQTESMAKPSEFDAYIEKYSKFYDVDPKVIKAVIKAESNYAPGAVSKKGASGLMQLMPDTARDMGVNNIFDPEENIMGGVKYFSQLSKMYDGDLKKTLAAYDAGPGRVPSSGSLPDISETKNYIGRVFGLLGRSLDLDM